MRTRPATKGDADALAALWTEAYTGRAPGGRQAPYEPAELLSLARSGRVFVTEDGGEVLGAVVSYPPGAPGRAVGGAGEAELSRLAVRAAARREGIGRALAELCGEQARREGAAAIVLWSRPYQVEAHRLYESLGYRRAPRRDSRDADGERLVFVLELGREPGLPASYT
jgi:ribosomal protein S18 acetylase RimI-like enzyme